MPAADEPLRLTIPPNCDVTLGLSCIDKSTPGVTVWQMAADECFANPVGVIQGGIVTALADSAMAASSVTANTGRKVFSANTELKISFLRPAKAVGMLTCTARAIANGRRLCFVEAEVVDDAGALIAKASSTYLLTSRDA